MLLYMYGVYVCVYMHCVWCLYVFVYMYVSVYGIYLCYYGYVLYIHMCTCVSMFMSIFV